MPTAPKRYLFLVDDEPIQNEMLKDYLSERFLFELETFDNGEDALQHMNKNPEIVILDYHLSAHKPGAKNGIEVLQSMKETNPDAQIIMLSGQDKIEVAIDTMKYGAYDYIVKGESAFSRIENAINNIGELHKMRAINQGYRNTILMLSIVIGLIIILAVYFLMIKPTMG